MYDVVTRPLARDDLKQIWRYTYDQWGVAQADHYLQEIDTAVQTLRENPKLGKACEQIRAGYRARVIHRHIIYYTITPGFIHVVRVLHARMHPDTKL